MERLPSLHQFLTLLLFLALSAACAPKATPGTPTPTLIQSISTFTLRASSTPTQVVPAPDETSQPLQTSATSPAPAETPAAAGFSIILGRPTADSISISLLSSSSQQVVLAYSTEPGSYTHQSDPIALQANLPQAIEMTQLNPDTTYFYQVALDGVPQGEHTFHTQRPPGSTFTFTIDADPHNRDPRFNGELYATTLTNARDDQPDFHINLGDTFMTEKARPETYDEAESTFVEMRPYLGIIGAEAPIFLINGNHEGEQGWLLSRGLGNQMLIWSTQLRQQYFPCPAPGSFYSSASTIDPSLGTSRDAYYAWTWGDALFISLDPFWYTTARAKPGDLDNNWNWTLGREQYDWLKATLETSQAKFKFVFIHHLVGGNDKDARGGIEAAPYFEWGGHNADGSYGFDEHRPGWGKPIHQLLVDNRVSAVFHGHDHVFVKQDLDGIVYQEVPQSSNAEYNKRSLAADYGYLNGVVFGSSGHLRVTVSMLQVTVEYVCSYLPQDENLRQQNGQIDYVYSIK